MKVKLSRVDYILNIVGSDNDGGLFSKNNGVATIFDGFDGDTTEINASNIAQIAIKDPRLAAAVNVAIHGLRGVNIEHLKQENDVIYQEGIFKKPSPSPQPTSFKSVKDWLAEEIISI